MVCTKVAFVVTIVHIIGKIGPRGFRETEFDVGGAGRRKFTELGALRHDIR